MTMKQPSASNAEAFAMCGASHVLPQSEKHNDYMHRGSEGHAPLAAMVNGKTPDTTERGFAMVKDFPLLDVLAGVTKRRGEAAFAVNVKTRTSRFIGINIGREYGKLEKYEIPCTLDVDGVKDNRPWVRDWKFGVSASWMQLMVQCMALAYDDPENPLSEVDAGFTFIDGDSGGSEYHEDARIVSLEEIDEAADRLLRAWDKVEKMVDQLDMGATLPTVEGSWCTYCGAFAQCPAKWEIAKNILAGVYPDAPEVAVMTLEQQGYLYEKLRERKKMIDGVMDTLKSSAEKNPLPLPNGKQLVMLRVKGAERIDKAAALKVMQELGASDDDYKRVIKQGAAYMTAKEMKR